MFGPRERRITAAISQIVSFAPQSVMGMLFSIELHKLAETGATHVTLRRLPDNP